MYCGKENTDKKGKYLEVGFMKCLVSGTSKEKSWWTILKSSLQSLLAGQWCHSFILVLMCWSLEELIDWCGRWRRYSLLFWATVSRSSPLLWSWYRDLSWSCFWIVWFPNTWSFRVVLCSCRYLLCRRQWPGLNSCICWFPFHFQFAFWRKVFRKASTMSTLVLICMFFKSLFCACASSV